MPFDNSPTAIEEAADPTGLAPEHRAKLETLERALRVTMPEGFRWDFGSVYYTIFGEFDFDECGTAGCALGLAHEIEIMTLPLPICDIASDVMVDAVARQLGLSWEQMALFYSAKLYDVRDLHDVTPTMVADRLRHFLDTGWVE